MGPRGGDGVERSWGGNLSCGGGAGLRLPAVAGVVGEGRLVHVLNRAHPRDVGVGARLSAGEQTDPDPGARGDDEGGGVEVEDLDLELGFDGEPGGDKSVRRRRGATRIAAEVPRHWDPGGAIVQAVFKGDHGRAAGTVEREAAL